MSEDLSPPRRSTRDSSPPRRRTRHDSDDDLSPPRKRHDSDRDLSPPRKNPPSRKRHNSDDDLSPPRKTRNQSPPPRPPPSRKRHDSDDDLSPPRKRHDSDNDLSPPRKRRHDSDNDLSPRRRGVKEDLSPPRRHSQRSGRDLSPPRKRIPKDSGDLSPPRKKKTESFSSSRKVGGLHTREEVERSNAEISRKAQGTPMGAEALGKGAATVQRDASGRALTINDLRRMEKEREAQEGAQEPDPWGKGLVQLQEREERLADLAEASVQPFARSANDESLNQMWKEQDRWEDPMARFVTKKQKKVKQTFVGNLEVAKVVAERRWSGPTPLNRFNIIPGNLWDGVDRSNGFEKKYLSRESNKKAKEEQAYLYEVEDF